MKKLMIYLAHAYPRVRVVTSQKVYEALLTYGLEEIPPDNFDLVMNLLSETKWDSDISQVRLIRNQICSLLNIPQPTSLKPSSS